MLYCEIYKGNLLTIIRFFRLPDGSLMDITKVYPLDAVFDNPEDVPEDVMDKKNIAYLLYTILV